MKNTFLLFTLFLLLACKETNKQVDFTIIDLREVIKGNYETVNISDIAVDLEIIPLETNDSSVFRDRNTVLLLPDRYYIITYEVCLMFNKNGGFVRTIGTKGQGPGEYIGIYTAMLYDDSLYFYDSVGGKMLVFDKDGNPLRHFTVPKEIEAVSVFEDGTFIGFYPNVSGIQPTRFIWFDNEGKTVYTYPYKEQTPNSIYYRLYDEGAFFEGESLLNFKEVLNDTIFGIKDKVLIPRYFFELGEKRANPNARAELIDTKAFLLKGMLPMTPLGETEKYLFFRNYSFPGIFIYDKNNNEVRLMNWDKEEDTNINASFLQSGKERYVILQVSDLNTEDNPVLYKYRLE